jgi:hypothetical protein
VLERGTGMSERYGSQHLAANLGAGRRTVLGRLLPVIGTVGKSVGHVRAAIEGASQAGDGHPAFQVSTPPAEGLASGAQIPGHEVEAGGQLIESLICQIRGRGLVLEVATADDDKTVGVGFGACDDHASALAEHQRGIRLRRLQQFPDIVSLDKRHG